MRRLALPLLLALSGPGCDCHGISLAGERDGDGGIDADDAAGPDDAAPADDSGLAPPCDDPPVSCLRAEHTATVQISHLGRAPGSGLSFDWYALVGLSATGDAGPVFVFDDGVPNSDWTSVVYHLQVRQFDAEGLPDGDPLELVQPDGYDAMEFDGDVLALADGSAIVTHPERHGSGLRTHVWTVRAADAVVEAESFLHDTGPVEATFMSTTAVVAGGRTWIASSEPDGVTLSPLDEPSRVLTVPFAVAPPVSALRAAALADGRIVLAWIEMRATGEPGDGPDTAVAAVVAAEAGAVDVPAVTIFPPTPPDAWASVCLAVNDDGIYLARYDRDDASLRDSRIRVARLDDTLHRVEPDRWINGWGGVTPGGMALVAWQDGIWVVFQTLDARYGTNPVLYAQPLAVPDCGYAVGEPTGVFVLHPAGYGNSLLAAAGDDELWTVVAYVRNNSTADLFRLVPCE